MLNLKRCVYLKAFKSSNLFGKHIKIAYVKHSQSFSFGKKSSKDMFFYVFAYCHSNGPIRKTGGRDGKDGDHQKSTN